jgi:hypothetical protein
MEGKFHCHSMFDESQWRMAHMIVTHYFIHSIILKGSREGSDEQLPVRLTLTR